jgi:hypothetical protein
VTTTAQTEGALLAALKTIRDNWAALIEPSAGSGSGGAKSADSITGLDRRVSLRHEVTLCLNGWSRLVVEELDLTEGLPLGTNAPGLVALLIEHVRWFSGHEASCDALSEIEACAADVRKAAAAVRAEWVHIGYCPTIDDDMICWGDVKAWPNAEPALAPFCQRCGRVEYVDEWERVMRLDAPLTHDGLLDFIRETFGREVNRATLRTWQHRRVLPTIGVDDTGQTLYDRGAVIFALTRRWHAA